MSVVAGLMFTELLAPTDDTGCFVDIGNVAVEGGGIMLDVVSLDSSNTR